jgi:hypothetical protein
MLTRAMPARSKRKRPLQRPSTRRRHSPLALHAGLAGVVAHTQDGARVGRGGGHSHARGIQVDEGAARRDAGEGHPPAVVSYGSVRSSGRESPRRPPRRCSLAGARCAAPAAPHARVSPSCLLPPWRLQRPGRQSVSVTTSEVCSYLLVYERDVGGVQVGYAGVETDAGCCPPQPGYLLDINRGELRAT